MIRILAIGLDQDVLSKEDSPVLRRQKEYARRLKWLGMIVFTPRGPYALRSPGPNFQVYPSRSFAKPLFVLDAVRTGIRICKNKNIDLLVTQEPFFSGLAGYILKLITGIPLVVHYHADFWNNAYWIAERPINRYLNIIARYITPRSNGIRVVSGQIRNKLEKAGIDSHRIICVPPPVEPLRVAEGDIIEAKAVRGRLGLEGSKVILYVGRLVPQKNVRVLVRAMRIITDREPKAKLLIIGDGPEKGKIKELSLKLGLSNRVILHPAVTSDELKRFYLMADVFALPSNYEGMPKVLREASMCGLPCVATAVSGVEDIIIDGKTGYLTPVNDEKELAVRLLKIIENPTLRKMTGEAAREFVTGKFSYEQCVDKIVAGWERIAFLEKRCRE